MFWVLLPLLLPIHVCAGQIATAARVDGMSLEPNTLKASLLSPITSLGDVQHFAPFLGKGSRPAVNAGYIVELQLQQQDSSNAGSKRVVEVDVMEV